MHQQVVKLLVTHAMLCGRAPCGLGSHKALSAQPLEAADTTLARTVIRSHLLQTTTRGTPMFTSSTPPGKSSSVPGCSKRPTTWGEDSSFVAQGDSHATLPTRHYQLHRRHVSAWTRPHATGGVACWRSPGLRVMIWPAACTPQCVHAASLAARGACPAAWRPAAHPTRGSQHPSTAQWRWKHTRDKVRRLNRHETGEGAHTSASVRLPSFGQPGRALPCPAPAPQSPWEGTPAKARVSTGRHVRGPSATTGATGRIALHNTWA